MNVAYLKKYNIIQYLKNSWYILNKHIFLPVSFSLVENPVLTQH